MTDKRFPDVQATIDDFTDYEASTKQTMQKISDFYVRAIEDIREFDKVSDCLTFLDRLTQIADGLESIARRDVEYYRYFLYGLFQGQVSALRHTIMKGLPLEDQDEISSESESDDKKILFIGIPDIVLSLFVETGLHYVDFSNVNGFRYFIERKIENGDFDPNMYITINSDFNEFARFASYRNDLDLVDERMYTKTNTCNLANSIQDDRVRTLVVEYLESKKEI